MTIARLTTPLRVVLVIVLFALGATSHGAAMAQGPMSGELPSVVVPMNMAMAGGHVHHSGACKSGHCGTAAPDCCIMGHCLLGVAPAPLASFASCGKPEQVAAELMIPVASPRVLPFRPPTLV